MRPLVNVTTLVSKSVSMGFGKSSPSQQLAFKRAGRAPPALEFANGIREMYYLMATLIASSDFQVFRVFKNHIESLYGFVLAWRNE